MPMKNILPYVLAGLLLACLKLPADAQNAPVVSWQKQADGVTLRLRPGVLKLQVWTPRIVRVTYSRADTLPNTQSLSVIAKPQAVPWQLKTDAHTVTVTTGQMQAQVNRQTGAVRFLDAAGKPVLSEEAGGRMLTPVTLAGPTPEAALPVATALCSAARRRHLRPGSAPGQGLMDYRGSVVTLEQTNREVAIPFLVSSRGYGVLWDNPAHTEIAVGTEGETAIPAAQLFTAGGKPGGLTGEYFQGQDFETR